MAGARLTAIRVDDAAVDAALGELARRGADLRPAMEEIGEALVTSTRRRFETETGPDGKVWPKSLRALLEGGKTLSDSGRLGRIIHQASDDSVMVGTDAPYAAIHQFGGTIRAKTAAGLRFTLADGSARIVTQVRMPARPFLGLDEDDGAEILFILENHLWEGDENALAGGA